MSIDELIQESISTVELICGKTNHVEMKEIGTFLVAYCDEPGFIVPFDKVVIWLKYSMKASAKRVLKNLARDVDYKLTLPASHGGCWGGANKEDIMLTTDGFQKFCMRSCTERGDMIRQLYIELLKAVKCNISRKHIVDIARTIEENYTPRRKNTMHNSVRDDVAKLLGGVIERRNSSGTADVETDNYVVEVKPVSDWMHGVGQSLGYNTATKKRPLLVLYGDKTISDNCKRTCATHDIKLLYYSNNGIQCI
jgi:hypothetical protein